MWLFDGFEVFDFAALVVWTVIILQIETAAGS
jgi:hypothetical protein